jgi:hypothetical protein
MTKANGDWEKIGRDLFDERMAEAEQMCACADAGAESEYLPPPTMTQLARRFWIWRYLSNATMFLA